MASGQSPAVMAWVSACAAMNSLSGAAASAATKPELALSKAPADAAARAWA
jgi:hypothetical protein